MGLLDAFLFESALAVGRAAGLMACENLQAGIVNIDIQREMNCASVWMAAL